MVSLPGARGYDVEGLPEDYGLVDLDRKLDLRPFDEYERSRTAVQSLKEGEYKLPDEAAEGMHPRVFHEVFRYPARRENAVVVEECLDEILEVLDDKSRESHGFVEEKLFNLGYRRSYPISQMSDAHEEPTMNHPNDNLPNVVLGGPTPLGAYRKGKKKRESDEYYAHASSFLINGLSGHDLSESEIEVVTIDEFLKQ